jgi:hypothetical protein
MCRARLYMEEDVEGRIVDSRMVGRDVYCTDFPHRCSYEQYLQAKNFL